MDPLLERVAQIRPKVLLDVGCGCGTFTKKLAEYCHEIIAVDYSPALVERAQRENGAANIRYLSASALHLPLADRSIDTVIERGSLHHVEEWQVMLGEMVRVSSQRVLALEPIDDPRSEPKRAAIAAHHLFLELQHEVGYPHFAHLTVDELRGWASRHGTAVQINVIRRDQPVRFEDYFEPWKHFANQSGRREYWMARREEFCRKHGENGLAADDLLLAEISRP